MKKIILLVCLFNINYSFAQTYTLANDSLNLTIPYSDVQNDQYYIMGLHTTLTNNTSDTVPSHWVRNIQFLSPGWNTSVCDPILCHGDAVDSSDFNFLPSLNSDIRVDFYPHQLSGYGIVDLKINKSSNAADNVDGIFIGTVEEGTGITSVEKLRDIKIFPNPAKEKLMVAATTIYNPSSIKLYDVFGKKINALVVKTSENLYSVNVESLKGGYYFIRLKLSNGTIITRSFTKE